MAKYEDGWEDVPDDEGWEDVPDSEAGWEDVPTEQVAAAPAEETRPDLLKEGLKPSLLDQLTGLDRIKMLGGIGQRLEAGMANSALSIQEGKMSPLDQILAAGQGFAGEKMGEFGDVYRKAGVDEKTSATLGLLTGMVLDPLVAFSAAKGTGKAAGAANKAVKELAPKVLNPVKAEEALNNAAQKATIESRQVYHKFAKDLSDRYGAAYEKAIGNAKVTSDKYLSALQDVAGEAGILEKDPSLLSPSESKFKKLLQSVSEKEAGDEAAREIPLAAVDKELKLLLGGKSGKMYGQGEHILTLARQKIGDLIAEQAPDLRLVNAKFSPELKIKSAAYKKLQPYARGGEFETERGVNFFKRVASGEALSPNEKDLSNFLNYSSNKDLLGDLIKTGKDLKSVNTIRSLLKNFGTGAVGASGAGAIYGLYQLAKR